MTFLRWRHSRLPQRTPQSRERGSAKRKCRCRRAEQTASQDYSSRLCPIGKALDEKRNSTPVLALADPGSRWRPGWRFRTSKARERLLLPMFRRLRRLRLKLLSFAWHAEEGIQVHAQILERGVPSGLGQSESVKPESALTLSKWPESWTAWPRQLR